MEQSTLLREWMAKGEEKGKLEGKRDSLLEVIQRWSELVREDLRKIIDQQNDLNVLSQWFREALNATSLEEFRTKANL